jgi:hypothetical protein
MATVIDKWYTAGAGARALLSAEQYGFAIDATTYDEDTAAAYVGGPVGGTLAIHADNVTDKPNLPLDAAAGLLKGASPLVQSGTSPKMVHHLASPYVRWSPHNYLLRSQEFDTGWTSVGTNAVSANSTTAPDGTSTADTISEDSANSRHIRYQSVSGVIPSGQFTGSVYLKNNTATYGAVAINDEGGNTYGIVVDLTDGSVTATDTGASAVGSNSVVAVGSGWYRVSITVTGMNHATPLYLLVGLSGSASPTFSSSSPTYTGNGTDSIYVWGAQFNRGPIAAPYLVTTSAARIGIPQSYDAAAAQYGILVEPAATNLCLRSEEFDNASWTKTDTSISANAVTAPDGSSNADKVIESATGPTSHEFFTAATFAYSASATVTLSVYAKAAERTIFQLYLVGSGRFAGAKFDLVGVTSGAGIGGSGGGYSLTSSSITAIGNGWYRCVASIATVTDTAGRLYISLCQNASTDTYTGDGTSGVYLWGAQVETDTVATSYIPTLGTTVTRAVDAVSAPVSSTPFADGAAGSVYLSTKLLSAGSGFPMMWAVDDGSNNDSIRLQDTSGAQLIVLDANVAQAELKPTTNAAITLNTAYKDAVAWNTNDFAHAKDGGTVGTDGAGSVPTSITTFWLGRRAAGDFVDPMMIYYCVFLPRRATNTELQGFTS